MLQHVCLTEDEQLAKSVREQGACQRKSAAGSSTTQWWTARSTDAREGVSISSLHRISIGSILCASVALASRGRCSETIACASPAASRLVRCVERRAWAHSSSVLSSQLTCPCVVICKRARGSPSLLRAPPLPPLPSLPVALTSKAL